MMRYSFCFTISIVACAATFYSCYPEEPVVPDQYNHTMDSVYSLAGQRWVLYQYRVGDAPVNYPVSDTLEFFTQVLYRFNNDTSTYSLYEVPYSLKLNLNGTRWGNLGGTVFDYSISNGDIQGLKFTETLSGTGAYYYLWMRRL